LLPATQEAGTARNMPNVIGYGLAIHFDLDVQRFAFEAA
jgi:hypothetical protein